ncbi:OB-fold domain-containing protein [Xanthobacter sp. V3C-3]|uniref:Zn-ribbon domain-containing OB-fold protein n=1 Tax=Xanthobacter lutulentifluminis TaxID=3119935 RepID=UPI0037262B6B
MPSSLTFPHDIEILRCAACGQLDPGPRELCPACHSPRMEAVTVPGDGLLVSWTLVRRPPTRFQADGPYAVAVVDLDCGVRLTGRLAATPQAEADAPPLGTRMRFCGGSAGMALFAPAAARL